MMQTMEAFCCMPLKNITIEKPTDADHGKNTIAKSDKTLFEIY